MKSFKDQSVKDYWELMKQWSDNPDALGFINVRKRGRVDSFGFECYLMYQKLLLGATVGVLSMSEDLNYIERIQNWLMAMKCEVEVKRLTKKVPANNIIPTFNRWDEIIDIQIVEQRDEFCGWELKMKTS